MKQEYDTPKGRIVIDTELVTDARLAEMGLDVDYVRRLDYARRYEVATSDKARLDIMAEKLGLTGGIA